MGKKEQRNITTIFANFFQIKQILLQTLNKITM